MQIRRGNSRFGRRSGRILQKTTSDCKMKINVATDTPLPSNEKIIGVE